jgi:hypothetical protein
MIWREMEILVGNWRIRRGAIKLKRLVSLDFTPLALKLPNTFRVE